MFCIRKKKVMRLKFRDATKKIINSRMMKKRHDGFNFIYEFICAISFSSFNFYYIYLYPQFA